MIRVSEDEQKARIDLAKGENELKIRPINLAAVPDAPVRPRKVLNMVLAMCLGLAGGVGLALLLNYFDHSIKTIYQLEDLTGVPALGALRDFKSSVFLPPRRSGS